MYDASSGEHGAARAGGVPPPPAAVFRVLIETRTRMGGPGGVLAVYPGLLVVTPSRLASNVHRIGTLVQRDGSVAWVKRPLFPPWVNRAIDIEPEGDLGVVRLAFYGRARRRLRPTLEQAGFEVRDVTSWSLLFGP